MHRINTMSRRVASTGLVAAGLLVAVVVAAPPVIEVWLGNQWCPKAPGIDDHSGSCKKPDADCTNPTAGSCAGCENTFSYWRECFTVQGKECRTVQTAGGGNYNYDCGEAKVGTCQGSYCLNQSPGGATVCGIRNCESR